MPWGLHRYQHTGDLHFLTFSCYRREPNFHTPQSRNRCQRSLEETRKHYKFNVLGYVVMPEHIHLLVTEPERESLATAMQAFKQSVSRHLASGDAFWQTRYYDFNLRTERKRIEKLRYIHRNPVKRGLVESPEQWPWSSFRQYAMGMEGTVKVSLPWPPDLSVESSALYSGTTPGAPF